MNLLTNQMVLTKIKVTNKQSRLLKLVNLFYLLIGQKLVKMIGLVNSFGIDWWIQWARYTYLKLKICSRGLYEGHLESYDNSLSESPLLLPAYDELTKSTRYYSKIWPLVAAGLREGQKIDVRQVLTSRSGAHSTHVRQRGEKLSRIMDDFQYWNPS